MSAVRSLLAALADESLATPRERWVVLGLLVLGLLALAMVPND